MDNEKKQILQEEANKIGDILEKKKMPEDKRQYLKELKKCMLDKKGGLRKPLKNVEKEAYLQSVCEDILEKKMKKGGVNHLLVTGRKIPTTPKPEDIDIKQLKEIHRRNVLRHNRTMKQKSKLFPIPENGVLKGGRKSRKTKKTSWK